MDRFIHLAMGAAEQVMQSSGIEDDAELKLRTGTLIGVGIGGLGYIEAMAKVIEHRGLEIVHHRRRRRLELHALAHRDGHRA